MREIFDLLEQKEQKILGLLCLLLVVALLFYSFIASGEKKTYLRTVDSLSSKQKEYQKIDSSKTEKKLEWFKWSEARRDIDTIKKEYFYKEKEDINQLRQDLEGIFNETKIHASDIKYDYEEFKREQIKKVNLTFNITGSYFLLKKFIHSVEKLPKFLVIEKIDFVEIDTQSGRLKLRIILAGYYES